MSATTHIQLTGRAADAQGNALTVLPLESVLSSMSTGAIVKTTLGANVSIGFTTTAGQSRVIFLIPQPNPATLLLQGAMPDVGIVIPTWAPWIVVSTVPGSAVFLKNTSTTPILLTVVRC